MSREKYCSVACKNISQLLPEEIIIEKIQIFYRETGRIPLKREFAHAVAAREKFGSWNKAIEAAGLHPNPVLFAKKWMAKDGHKCDSLAEKIIDDWLSKHQIQHTRSVPYPGNATLSADFVIKDYWIEFFGLFGELTRYDELRDIKLKLVKKHSLKFIAIYPKDLFPKNRLEEILRL